MSRTIDVDTKTFVRFWLVILAFVLIGAFIWQAKTGILIVLGAAFLAIALSPLAHTIDRIDKNKERSKISAVISVVLLVVGIVAVIGFVGPVVVNETTQFASEAPAQIAKVLNDDTLNNIGNNLGIPDLKDQIMTSLSDASKSIVTNLSGFALDSFGAISSIITTTILVIVLTIFFMLEGPDMMNKFWDFVDDKSSNSNRKVVQRVVNRMGEVIAKYVSGQAMVALLDGVVVMAAVFVLSLIFGFSAALAIPMGLFAMVCYLIPMFGPIITAVIVTLLIFFSNPWAALVFLVFYVIYAQIENNAISPRIQGKGLSLPPLVILISITIGMYAFGLIGCIVAIPVAGCIRVLIEEMPALRKMHSEETSKNN